MAQGIEASGFAEFDRLRDLFVRTRKVLNAVLVERDLPDGASEWLASESLAHVEDVEAGFRAWLRAGGSDLAELRQLILQGGLGPGPARTEGEAKAALIEAMMARAGAGGERELATPTAARLVALEHARLVFAMLPATRDTEVHYPSGRRTYADIAAPRTATELALRIEELERELWRVAAGRTPHPQSPSYRRTFGFFDVAAGLADHGLHVHG